MASLFASGMPWLRNATGGNASVDVTLRRGGASTETTAVPGATEFIEEQGEQVIGRTRSRDYLIDIANYAFEDQPTKPEAGDRIIETINGRECEFEVCGRGGEPPFIYSDRGRTQYRVHTVQVAE